MDYQKEFLRACADPLHYLKHKLEIPASTKDLDSAFESLASYFLPHLDQYDSLEKLISHIKTFAPNYVNYGTQHKGLAKYPS